MVDLDSISIENNDNQISIKTKSYPVVHHFYHIYCGVDYAGREGSWIPAVDLHLNAIKEYGLVDHMSTMHVGLVGDDHHRIHAQQFIKDHGINFTVVSESVSGFEQVTQNQLYKFAQTNNGHVLYAHTKGSFNFNDMNNNWQKSMTYLNVVKWRECVDQLKNHDAVGAYWYDFSNDAARMGPHTGQKWFAGTFWWANLNRIRDIGHGPTEYTRWDAEVWIGQIPDISIYNLAPGGAAGELIEWV